MAINKIPLNSESLSLYLEGSKGLLFHQPKQSVFQLPPLSVAFLLAIDEGLTEQRAIAEIAQSSELSFQQLRSFYLEVKALFSDDQNDESYFDGRYPELNNALSIASISVKPKAFTCQVANSRFSISSNCEHVKIDLRQLLARCEKKLVEVDFELEVEVSDDQYYLYSNDHLFAEQLKRTEVIPEIIDRLQILAYQRSDYYFCYHGAAIKTEQGILLLPGKSGSGKSTLSAEITAEGNQLFSDEIIALDKSFNLLTLTLPIAIKSGSWEHLSKQYPELDTATIYKRLDGRKLKYVWPEKFAISQSITNNKVLLVNPKFIDSSHDFDANSESKNAKRLSIIDTLAMLSESGYQIGVEMDKEKLDLLINFLLDIHRFEITYQSSEQAKTTLTKLW